MPDRSLEEVIAKNRAERQKLKEKHREEQKQKTGDLISFSSKDITEGGEVYSFIAMSNGAISEIKALVGNSSSSYVELEVRIEELIARHSHVFQLREGSNSIIEEIPFVENAKASFFLSSQVGGESLPENINITVRLRKYNARV